MMDYLLINEKYLYVVSQQELVDMESSKVRHITLDVSNTNFEEKENSKLTEFDRIQQFVEELKCLNK